MEKQILGMPQDRYVLLRLTAMQYFLLTQADKYRAQGRDDIAEELTSAERALDRAKKLIESK